MAALKWLNNLVLIENFIAIYRNYYTQNKTKKCFIFFHIFVETVLHTLMTIVESYVLYTSNLFTQITHIYSVLIISSCFYFILSAYTGIFSSPDFMSYYASISCASERFKDDKNLLNSLKKLYWFSIAFVLLIFMFAVYRSLDVIMSIDQIDTFVYFSMFIFLSQSLVRFNILFEKLMFFVVIMIVVFLSKCLNSLVLAAQEGVGRCDISSDVQCGVTREQIQEWVELYRDLANSCRKVSLSFGRQFFCSLMITASYYILLTYQMCYLNYMNVQDKKIAIVILSYVLMTVLVIVAAQFVLNQGLKFHRILAQLYNKMIIIDSKEAEVKLIKDFIRLIKKKPLEIKLLSNTPAGTYFLPVILMTTVNYIIVMLQFNNIL